MMSDSNCAKNETHVSKQMRRLNNSIDELDEFCDVFLVRLAAVLRPGIPTTKSGPTEADAEMMVDHAANIAEVVSRVETISQRIQEAINRLEL